MNLSNNLLRAAKFFPNKPALREDKLELSYLQLNEKVNRTANTLVNLGVKPGDLVGLCVPNSIDWIIIYFGIIKTGATAVTLDNSYTDSELNNHLNHCKSKILFTTANRLPGLKNLKEQGILKHVICIKDSDQNLHDLLEKASGSFKAVDRERDEISAILYTAGTTGASKGAMLTHEGMIFSSQAISVYEHSKPDDVALCFQPFNHVFGQIHIMNATIFSAGCLELLPKFDIEKVLYLTESGRITKYFSVPTVYVRLLDLPDLKNKLGKVNYCFSAAASMAMEIVKQWKERTGITIIESLGMTEAMPVTFNHFYPEHHVVGSVGEAVCGVEVQIRHVSTGELMNPGEEGEICIRGRSVMKSYLYNPQATADAFWPGGWMRSGDIGICDENSYIYITDRLKDLIKTGGESVSPREVEEVLYTASDVAECSVVGIPDKEWGEKVIAFVKPKPGKNIVPDQVKAYLKTKLAPYKVPKEYITIEEFPKNSTGKILKRELRKHLIEKRK